MPAYTWKKTKKKQSGEYARILSVSDEVHSIRSLYKLLNSYRDRGASKTLSNIQDGAFCKKNNALVQKRHQKYFRSGEGDLWNYGTSINILSKTQEKETP